MGFQWLALLLSELGYEMHKRHKQGGHPDSSTLNGLQLPIQILLVKYEPYYVRT